MNSLDNKRPNLSDGEFLSFLYAERDRESSLRQYQGWNIWALVGAIAAVSCSGYYVLKENRATINYVQVSYLVSGVFALFLCYHLLALLFSRERGVDYQKLKALKDVAPKAFLWLAFMVTSTCSSLIPIIDKDDPWSIISIGWMVAFVLFVFAIIMVFVNRNKIVKTYIDGSIFVNHRWDMWFSVAVFLALSLVWKKSLLKATSPLIGSSGFEFGVCIIVFVFLVYLLVKVCLGEKMANKIDLLIDDYVYNGCSKESTFRMLRIGRMGNTVLESCAKEVIDIGRGLEDFDQKRQKLEEIDHVIDKGNVDSLTFEKYVIEMDEIHSFLRSYFKRITDLKDKLLQIEKQVPELKDEKEYIDLVTVFNNSYAGVESLVKISRSITDKMGLWFQKYYCNKNGGFCERECEHRHDRRRLKLRIKHLWGRITRNKKK